MFSPRSNPWVRYYPDDVYCQPLHGSILALAILPKETTDKPKNAVRNSINKSKRKTPIDPEIAPATKIATPSPVKKITARKRAAMAFTSIQTSGTILE